MLASADDATQSRPVSPPLACSEVSWSQSRSQGPVRWPEEVTPPYRAHNGTQGLDVIRQSEVPGLLGQRCRRHGADRYQVYVGSQPTGALGMAWITMVLTLACAHIVIVILRWHPRAWKYWQAEDGAIVALLVLVLAPVCGPRAGVRLGI